MSSFNKIDGQEKHFLFHSFCLYPRTCFKSLLKNEEIILVLRAHPVTQLPWVIFSLLLLVSPLIANLFIYHFLSFKEFIFINIFWYFSVITFIYLKIFIWIFNVGIVTSKRIIDNDVVFIFERETSEVNNCDVEDVTSKVNGFFPSIFNYGDVYLQTAGTAQCIQFLNVPRPQEVVTLITDVTRSNKPEDD